MIIRNPPRISRRIFILDSFRYLTISVNYLQLIDISFQLSLAAVETKHIKQPGIISLINRIAVSLLCQLQFIVFKTEQQ